MLVSDSGPAQDHCLGLVLILVLVDVGLGPLLKMLPHICFRLVLILVLVDVGLGLYQ